MPPLATLPVEVRAQILKECDARTLAVACQVCTEFLESASKCLYEHVHLSTLEQARLLFCDLDESIRCPAISPFLSLYRIRSVSLSIPREDSGPTFSRSRLPSGPIPLDLLSYLAMPFRARKVTTFNGLLNTSEVVVQGNLTEIGFASEYAYLDNSWSRLDRLVLRECLSPGGLYKSPLVRTRRPLRIVVDVSSLSSHPHLLPRFLGNFDPEEGTLLAEEGVSVVVRLDRDESSEEIRQKVWELLGSDADPSPELFVEQWDRIIFEQRSP